MRQKRTLFVVALMSGSSLMIPALAAAKPPPGAPIEITDSSSGVRLATEAADRQAALGQRIDSADLHVWRLGPGDYLVGKSMPRNLVTSTTTNSDGQTELAFSYDVDSRSSMAPVAAANLAPDAAVTASWKFVAQACFSRLSNGYGWLDSCYRIDKIVNEGDPRDFCKLEQYGTVGASGFPYFGKIYSGWLAAAKSSSSAAMSWIDWSPRGNKSGSCVSIPLSISALGLPFSTSGVMCEHWNIYKYADAGHFKEEWSCGCIIPFGQPYPNTREIDYLQAISVLNGKLAQWTLSAGFAAVPGS
jgi:hypothetical protein